MRGGGGPCQNFCHILKGTFLVNKVYFFQNADNLNFKLFYQVVYMQYNIQHIQNFGKSCTSFPKWGERIWTKSKIQHFSQETVPNNPWQIWPGIFGNNKKAKLCIFSPLSPFKFNSSNSVHNVKSNHHIADRKEHNKNLKIQSSRCKRLN